MKTKYTIINDEDTRVQIDYAYEIIERRTKNFSRRKKLKTRIVDLKEDEFRMKISFLNNMSIYCWIYDKNNNKLVFSSLLEDVQKNSENHKISRVLSSFRIPEIVYENAEKVVFENGGHTTVRNFDKLDENNKEHNSGYFCGIKDMFILRNIYIREELSLEIMKKLIIYLKKTNFFVTMTIVKEQEIEKFSEKIKKNFTELYLINKFIHRNEGYRYYNEMDNWL